MKNIKKTICIGKKTAIMAGIAACTFLSGCKKDLLDVDPKTKILTANMWKTENLTELGVVGVYQNMRNGKNLYEYDAFSVLQGRESFSILNGTITTSDGLFSDAWRNLFEGVNRANDAIYGITNISPSAPEKKARFLAEVKFLRAYHYYRLNQLFRGVPIYTEPIEWDKVDKPRSSEREVWDLIIKDLTDCINEPTIPDRYAASDANYGRVARSAAYALRGKVYIYTEEWQKAIDDFQKVKDLGHSLFADYAALFKDENEKCPEIIFSIQNKPLAGYGSNHQFVLGTRSAFGSNWNTVLVHPDLVDLYENKDGSKFNWNDIIPGYNEMDPKKREVYFLRNNMKADEITNMTKKGLDMNLYLPTGNEERLAKTYANRDPRLAINMILPYSTFVGSTGVADRIVSPRWPYRSETEGDLKSDSPNEFYYLARKFVYPGGNPIPARDAGGYDYIVIRYADVLLLWAEALNELNKPSDAAAKVNEVRNRAGVKAIDMGIDPNILRGKIRDERRRELTFEGFDLFDEMRWKTWKDYTFYQGNGTKQVWGAVLFPYQWVGDKVYTWPVTRVEMERNPNMVQNTGWDD